MTKGVATWEKGEDENLEITRQLTKSSLQEVSQGPLGRLLRYEHA